MSDLIPYLLDRYGEESALAAAKAIENLLLPIPMSGEFYDTSEGGALILLNHFACAVRITSNEYPLVRHPHILQPLGSIKAHDLRVDINPGIVCPATYREVLTMKALLQKDGLEFFYADAHKHNIGYLPLCTPEFPRGFPVVIEMAAVTAIHENIKDIKDMLQYGPSEQEEIFGRLKNTFNETMRDGSGKPYREKMRNFWNACATQKQEELLVSGWLDTDDPPEWTNGLYAISKRYEARLQQAPPVPA